MTKLMILDLDGTLFNTNLINYCSYNEILKKYGYSLDYEEYANKYNGKSYKYFLPIITKNASNDIIEKIHNEKKQIYSKYLNKAIVNEHLFRIIENNKRDYKMVIVTTASRKNTLEILEYYKKEMYFDAIITSEDCEHLKPNPEGYIIAMNKFNVDPEDTIIFEDSDIGLEAAYKTNAIVFKVEKF